MSKRFRDTELWDEDWFLSLSPGEMLFWSYICDRCDHAGLWRPNFKRFEALTTHRINQVKFLSVVNSDLERVRVLPNGKWLIVGFIPFQYGKVLSQTNRFHKGIISLLENNDLSVESTGCSLGVSKTPTTPQGRGQGHPQGQGQGQCLSLDSKDLKVTDQETATPRVGTYTQVLGTHPPDTLKASMSEPLRRLMKAYPRQSAKVEVYREWAIQAAGMTNEQEKAFADKCIAAVESQKKSDSWKTVQYIPELHNWIKKGRWDDKPVKQLTPVEIRANKWLREHPEERKEGWVDLEKQ
jgi:hypothetical protein